mgnify:CR=1 FL=1
MRRSAAELVADARAGRLGEYYQLWRAIAAQTTLPQSGPVLLDVVRRESTYLVRYHAAAALLALLGTAEFDPVDLTAGRPGEAAALDALERLLQERLTSEHAANFDADRDPSNGYEAIAADFAALRSASTIGVTTVRDWARNLEPGASILDVGCGTGLPISAALVGDGFEVFAIDAAPTLVADFRRRLPEVAVACEAVETSAFFGRAFDGAVAIGVLFLMTAAQQREAIGRIAAALNPGGRMLFTSPREPCTWSDSLTGRLSLSLGHDGYASILANLGLSLVGECCDEGDNHYYSAVLPEHTRSTP